MVTKSLQHARDILNGIVPEGGVLGNTVFGNEDEVDSVGIVDMFCHEEEEKVGGTPTNELTIDTSADSYWFDPLESPLFPLTSLLTPRTYCDLGAGLDFDVADVFEEDAKNKYGQYEFESEHGKSLAIDSNKCRGINLGNFVTDSIYKFITFSPFPSRSSNPTSFFGEDYM